MKPKQIFISILAVLFVFPLMGTFAQQAANSGSIEVITTFDYPGTGNLTLPQKINERGDVVGEFIDSSGVTRGFVRFSDGSFSAPIVDPNDTVGFTEGRGINNPRTVVGDYATSDGNLHGFFLSGGTFTEYDVPSTVQTNLLSINNDGTLTGAFDPDGSGILQGFFVRVVASGLYSHVLYTGLVGMGIGYFVSRRQRRPSDQSLEAAAVRQSCRRAGSGAGGPDEDGRRLEGVETGIMERVRHRPHLLDVLERMGARVSVFNRRKIGGELIGDLERAEDPELHLSARSQWPLSPPAHLRTV